MENASDLCRSCRRAGDDNGNGRMIVSLAADVFSTFRTVAVPGEIDLDHLTFDDDTFNVLLDKIALIGRLCALVSGVGPKTITKRLDDNGFNIRCRYATDAARFAFSFLQNRVRDIIAISGAELVRMGRGHAVATVVKDPAREDCGRAPEP